MSNSRSNLLANNLVAMRRPSGQNRSKPSIEVLALQGWACDRYTDRAMIGAGLVAREIGKRLGRPETRLGTPGAPADLGWCETIERSAPYLHGVARTLSASMADGALPVIAANRCAATIATIPVAMAQHPDACLVWIDAHGDYNTPDITETGYLGGMVISSLCGEWESGFGAGLTPDRVILVGMRDLDPAEEALLVRRGVTIIKSTRSAEGRFAIDTERLTNAVAGREVWLHVDCDVMDPALFPAEYKIPDGLTPADLRATLRAVVEHADLVGFEITEFEAPRDDDACAVALGTLMAVIEPVLAKVDAA